MFCTVVLQHSTYLFYINASLHKSMQIHEEQALCYCLTRLSYLFSSKIALLRWKENLLISSKYIILISANSSSLKLAYLLCYFNLPSDFWCSLVSRSVRYFFLKARENFRYRLLSLCLLLLSQLSPFPSFKRKVDKKNWMMTWVLQKYCRNAQWVTVYVLDLVLPVPSLPSLLSGTTALATLFKLFTEETESCETPSRSLL